jgi:uncharacterized RDD family membrane protein YckC
MTPQEADTSFRVQTPEGIEYSLYPAGLPIRACAYGIDTFFQLLIMGAFLVVFSLVLEHFVGVWIILLLKFVLDWFYHVIWELCCRGQSPGKRLVGIRVVQNDGSPVSPGASLIRNLLRFADNFLGLYLIVFLTLIGSKAFRRPGDWAAGTLVIYTWQSQAPERRDLMAWLNGVTPASPGRSLTTEEKQGLLMFARRYPLLGPARADEIARPMAASLRGAMAASLRGAMAASLRAGSGAADVSDSAYLLGIARTFAGEFSEPETEVPLPQNGAAAAEAS